MERLRLAGVNLSVLETILALLRQDGAVLIELADHHPVEVPSLVELIKEAK